MLGSDRGVGTRARASTEPAREAAGLRPPGFRSDAQRAGPCIFAWRPNMLRTPRAKSAAPSGAASSSRPSRRSESAPSPSTHTAVHRMGRARVNVGPSDRSRGRVAGWWATRRGPMRESTKSARRARSVSRAMSEGHGPCPGRVGLARRAAARNARGRRSRFRGPFAPEPTIQPRADDCGTNRNTSVPAVSQSNHRPGP